jgi:hypothetical protein
VDRLEIGEATGARSMRQRFDVSGTSPGEAIRLPIQIVALHAARSFAADDHDCIMVRIRTDLPHTSVRRENAPQCQAPLESLLRQAPSDTGARRKARLLSIVPPRAQASRRCETQATLGGRPPSFASVSVP